MRHECLASAGLGVGAGLPGVGGDGELRAGGQHDAKRFRRSGTLDLIAARTHAEPTATRVDLWRIE